MNVAIVSNIDAGIGLKRDYELLRGCIEELGHTVKGFQYDAELPPDTGKFDVALFLERTPRNLFGLSEQRWFWGNPEWTGPDIIQLVDRSFQKVFAKTHEAERIYNELFPGRVYYVGFLARDQYDPAVKREPWFLHIGGNSSLRGTQAVLDAWKWRRNGKSLDAKLCIVSTALKDRPVMKNVDIWEHLSEEDLKTLQNKCLHHIYPSETEGYGHAIHEAQSVGACVFLTNAPPMNEMKQSVTILPAKKAGKYNLADLYEVSALDIFNWVELMSSDDLKSGKPTVEKCIEDTRVEFLRKNQEFKDLFSKHLEESSPKSAPIVRSARTGKSIAFIGNFEAPESTENMVKWALENRLDWNVETLQENRVNLAAIEDAMKFNDALLWIRTPGWLNVPDDSMSEFLKQCDKPTISMHLDKFFSIPEREKLIGKHPFWLTAFCFTADGSRDEDFRKLGVNHFWMKPAVSEVYCHPGIPRDEYRCDVGFVGAGAGYHDIYPFRQTLLTFLKEEYGDRFKHVEGVRGHPLNDVYASMTVVVGDCFGAGTPRYWSDRIPETCGRFGLLIHPAVRDLKTPLWVYEPQNLVSLKTTIEGISSHSKSQRMGYVASAAEYTRTHDTWTIRLKEMFEVVGI